MLSLVFEVWKMFTDWCDAMALLVFTVITDDEIYQRARHVRMRYRVWPSRNVPREWSLFFHRHITISSGRRCCRFTSFQFFSHFSARPTRVFPLVSIFFPTQTLESGKALAARSRHDSPRWCWEPRRVSETILRYTQPERERKQQTIFLLSADSLLVHARILLHLTLSRVSQREKKLLNFYFIS